MFFHAGSQATLFAIGSSAPLGGAAMVLNPSSPEGRVGTVAAAA